MSEYTPNMRDLPSQRFYLIGWLTIAFIFGGLLIWSIAAPFEGAVIASGSIGVESQHKAIQHLEGGIVSDIYAKEGLHVERGDLLIRLDGTVMRTKLSSLNARLNDLLAREARFIAEKNNQSKLTLRSSITPTPDIENALQSQTQLLKARLNARNTRIAIIEQKITQMARLIDGLKADIKAKHYQTTLLNEEIESLQFLVNKGLAPKPRILALLRTRSEIESAAQTLNAEIAATNVRIQEEKLEIIQLDEGFLEEVLSELNDVQTTIATLVEDKIAITDQLSRLEILAPRTGIVLGIRTHTIGGVVSAGTPLMYIVPEGDPLIAQVRIAPQDVDKLFITQTARLKFSAFSQRNTLELEGNVTKISADTLQDETTGTLYYDVTVAISSPLNIDDDFQPIPGMPVEVILRTDSRNVLSYLTKPLFDSIGRTFRE